MIYLSYPTFTISYSSIKEISILSHDLWYNITSNKVTFDSALVADGCSVINTLVQIDGIGRAVRTAKTGYVEGINGWNVSGSVEYDKKGRTVKEGMTEFIKGDLENLLNTTPIMAELFTSYKYDDKDRQIRTILPDGSIQTASFEITNGNAVSRSNMQPGDIIVWSTNSNNSPTHVSLFIGGDTMIHAANRRDGVILSSVSHWESHGGGHIVTIRRV